MLLCNNGFRRRIGRCTAQNRCGNARVNAHGRNAIDAFNLDVWYFLLDSHQNHTLLINEFAHQDPFLPHAEYFFVVRTAQSMYFLFHIEQLLELFRCRRDVVFGGHEIRIGLQAIIANGLFGCLQCLHIVGIQDIWIRHHCFNVLPLQWNEWTMHVGTTKEGIGVWHTILLRSASSHFRSVYFFSNRFICKSNLVSSVDASRCCRTVSDSFELASRSSDDELSMMSISLWKLSNEMLNVG